MRFYRVTKTVRFPSGTVIALNMKQFNLRQHLLEPPVDGITLVREPIEFKAGEIVGLGVFPFALNTQLEPLEFDDEGDAEIFGVGWLDGEEIKGELDWRPDDDESGKQQQPESGDPAPEQAKPARKSAK